MDPTSVEAKANNTAKWVERNMPFFSFLFFLLFIFDSLEFTLIQFSFENRLTNIKENHKFQKDGKESQRVEDPTMGIRHIVAEIKEKHSI